MVLHIINSSEVRPGDHLYRYRLFNIQQGIAVQCPTLKSIFVLTSYKNTLQLVSLNEFKRKSCLRRVIYNENCSCIKKVKYLHNRPPEEIVKNALLLLDWIKTSPDNVRKLFSNDLSQFAQECCTTVHEQWCNLFYSTYEQISLKKHFFDKKQISNNSNSAFNAALMCGMPFRQASQIGKNEFWIEKNDEIDLLQTTEDPNDQLLTLSKTTSDEPMIFSSTLMEFSSDEDISLI
ncbi:unnamed protein product [Adineta steineri]|uniref:Uncharacterized protein n=1 Tax=Adineta steineri TaxID=433720 RepID=A0A819V8W9_9BILA|nr:unnamed protein product [Adineta steineri]CAF4105298.1 unnamed protein product [Adineta steineri]